MMGDKPLSNMIRALVYEAAWTRILSILGASASNTGGWIHNGGLVKNDGARVDLRSMRLGHCLDAQSASASTMATVCSRTTHFENAQRYHAVAIMSQRVELLEDEFNLL